MNDSVESILQLPDYTAFSGADTSVNFPVAVGRRYFCILGEMGSTGANGAMFNVFVLEIGYDLRSYAIKYIVKDSAKPVQIVTNNDIFNISANASYNYFYAHRIR